MQFQGACVRARVQRSTQRCRLRSFEFYLLPSVLDFVCQCAQGGAVAVLKRRNPFSVAAFQRQNLLACQGSDSGCKQPGSAIHHRQSAVLYHLLLQFMHH